MSRHHLQRSKRLFHIFLLFFLTGILLLLVWQLPIVQADASTSPQQLIAQAWQLAQDSGRYAFDSQIAQTTYPLPSLTNAGRPPENQQIALAGQVDKAAETTEITFWHGVQGSPEQGMTIRTENGRSQRRLGLGEWETIQENTDFFVPNNDPLVFLQVAANIQDAGTDTIELGDHSLTYQLYTFDIDATEYSHIMRQRLEEHLAQYGRLPDNLTLETPALYRDMTGTGQLWLDADGLPSRLTLDLQLPPQDKVGRTEASFTSDFHGYDRSRIALASAALWQNPQSWWAFHQVSLAADVRQTAVPFLLILLIVLFLSLILPYRRTKAFNAALSFFVVISILTGPLLQGHQVQAFQEKVTAAQTTQTAEQAKNEQLATARDQLQQPHFNPHLSPSEQLPVNSKPYSVNSSQSPIPNPQSPNLSISQFSNSSTIDSDNDGLSDSDEDLWHTCAYSGAANYCDGVADSTDSDSDGLRDGLEVYNLTTHPAYWDSDGDLITDTLEINGFSYNNQMWYLNPNEQDSNKDGLIDSLECTVWIAGSDYDPNAVCPDSDNDGTPDVWDDDNDNDGVLDATDISPFHAGSQVYTYDNPLTLQIDSLQPDLPVFVNVQLRPQNPEHLDYIGTVLDWPTGDTQGQIQRRLDTTFANTANTDLQATDSLAGNGDIRLVPIMEMTIPYTPGHYGNLPVLPAYQGISRTLDIPVTDWLDTSKLDPYGVSVDDADDGSGDLIVSLPLTAVTDDVGGGRSAYAFQMLYWPQQTNSQNLVDWAAPHEYRIQWLVQMITDECIDPDADPDTCTRQDTATILHVYREEWMVTGISIREDHDFDVAMLYEDPTQDSNPNFEDDLWLVSWNLNNQFLRGRDCDALVGGVCQSDGQRDVTIANLDSKIAEWSTDTDSIAVSTFNYDHHGFMTHVMMTETVSLLDSVFSPTGVTTATLMFASEETYRSSNLGVADDNGGALTFDLLNVPTYTYANLSWAPYRQNNGVWQNDDTAQYLDRLREQLSTEDYFLPEDNSTEGQEDAEGKLIWAQLYYAALYNGLSTRVAVSDDPLWKPSKAYGDIPEDQYEVLWPPSTFSGASTVAFAYLTVLSTVFTAKVANGSIWQQLSRGFSKTYPVNNINRQFSGLQNATNALFAVTTVTAVVGFTLFTVGFISGDAKLQRIGEIILNATTVALTTVAIVNYLAAFQLADSIGAVSSLSNAYSFSWDNNVVGKIGIVVQLVIIWGGFLFSAMSAGILNNPNSIPFNMLLAFAVAQTIVALLFFFISVAIPILGNLIILAIILTEAILSFFGYEGAQAWLTEKIAESLYDVDFVIRNLNSSERLQFNFVDMTLVNDNAGFTTAQAISYTMDVTNTLRYAGGQGPDEAKKATFRYFLQSTPTDQHDALSLNDMNNEWHGAGHNKIETHTTAALLDGPISFSTIGAGQNQTFGNHLYLTEAFVTPYIGCWRVIGLNTSCTTYSYSGSVHINVGEFAVFDILPATLSGFYNFMGNLTEQADQDGDGLLRATDPFPTKWDGDGDGLSDYYELANGLKADEADGDGDGLTDSEELRRGLDPLNADADGDGLTDDVEWQGWQVVYDYDALNNPLLTWVWPYPYLADGDEDRFSDQEEYFYALNPRIPSSTDAILDTIQFSDGKVTEQGAPSLLLRFDEASGATSFLDNATGELAFCASDSCPAAGENGRYNHALTFDGTNDYIHASMDIDPNAGSFTAAAWFNVSDLSTNRTILQQANGTTGTNRVWLYVLPSGKISTSLGGTGLTVNQAVGVGEWHHTAVTYDGTTLSLYLDGQLKASDTRTLEASDGELLVGIGQDLVGRPFAGSIDEVTLYNMALDATAIANLAAAKYNVSDNVVAPGDTLDFQMTISNTNPVYPAQVVYYGETHNFTTVQAISPTGRLYMDESAGATTFAIEGMTAVATCNPGANKCPTAGVGGQQGTALYFDGDDEINADALLQNYSGTGWTISLWFYPEPNGPTSYNNILVNLLDNNGGINRDDTKFLMTYSSQDQTCCGLVTPGSVPFATWHNFTVAYDGINDVISRYYNGTLVNQSIKTYNLVSGDRFRIGGPNAPDWNFDDGFEGRIDDVVFYDRALSGAQIQTLLAGGTPEFPILPTVDTYAVGSQNNIDITASFTIPDGQPSGAYIYSQLAEAALDIPDLRSVAQDPQILIHFDEPGGSDYLNAYPQKTSFCSSCPVLVDDFAGKAVEFDGTGTRYGWSGVTATGPWAMSTWIYPTHSDNSSRGIMGSVTDGFPALYITSDDKLGFAFHDGTGWNSDYTPGGTIPRNQWSQVGVTYDGAGHFQTYLNGQPVGDDALIEGLSVNFAFGNGWVGHIGGGHQPFQGRMDNVVFYDDLLTPAQMATLHGTEDLSLHLHYALDEPPGSNVFLDSAGIYGDADCTNCPTLGIRGAVNRAAYFDGNQIDSIANAPDHWRAEGSATKWAVAFWLKAEYGRVLENKSVVLPFRIWTNRIDYGRDCCVPDWGNGNVWPAPDPTEWTHIVISYDQDDPFTGGIFINGEQIESGGSILIRELFGPSPFRIGGSLKGYVDDVRLYNRAFSADEVLKLYETSRPALQYEFEEDATAVSFTDLSPNEYNGTIVNAIPGLAGRIGNGVEFDGSSYVDAGAAANINTITDTLTIMTWVRPDQATSNPQLLVGAGLENSANGFGLGIEGSALWLSDGVTIVSSGDIGLLADTWQQVAVKVGSDGTVTFYLDGEPVGTGGVVSLAANTDDHLYLGGRPLSGGTLGDYYSGQVDELFIYARALSNAEIGSAYDNQFRWFRKQFDTHLVVDNDVPTITLQTNEQYWPNSYIQLAVGTSDATSAIWSFEYGLQAPGDMGLTWQAAPACADVSIGTVWCPYFDPSTLAGEGEYQLQFRTVDSVGNETTSPLYSLYVDDTAPVVTSNANGSWRTLLPDPDTELGWTLPLSGTVSDPTLVGGVAGSGVYTPSVMVQLVNQAGGSLSEPQLAAVNGSNWSLDYEVFGRPHGRFYLKITVEDAVGNASTTSFYPHALQLQPLAGEGELLLDARPASVDSDDWLLPEDVISQVVTLSGVASELPIWGSAVARYHFEEASGTTVYDHSALDNHAICTACPSPAAGPFGQAYSFDGVDDVINTPSLFNPMTTTFSIALWFNPASAGSGMGGRPLVKQEDGSGIGRLLFFVDGNNYLRSNLGQGTTGGFAGETAVTHDVWHHAVLVYDGTNARIYLDGRLDGEKAIVAESADGGLNLGGNPNAATYFPGEMDEVMVFDRVLSEDEILALATDENSGVSAVDVWLEPFAFNGTPGTPNWQSATVDSPLTNLSTWQYNLPTGLEGFYQINLRGTDDFGNVSSNRTVWRGIMDMVTPTVSVTAAHLGGGGAAQTEISFTASDPFLDMGNLSLPCASNTWQTSTYQADQIRIDGITATCRIPGHELNPITAQVCDLAGHCAADTITLSPSPQVASVAILSPTHNVTISGNDLVVPISGGAYDTNGIETVALQINGVDFDTVAIGGGATDTLWSMADWMPTSSGTYTLTAVMTNTLNTAVFDTINVNIEVQNCFTEYDGDNITDFASDDARAVQQAVDAAPADSTIKIAGICAGVQGNLVMTQTVAITKSLTLVGGYELGGSWAVSQPDVYETRLDASENGRVATVIDAGNVTFKNLTLTGGKAVAAGGFTNPANYGGGLFQQNGTVYLENVLIQGNYAERYGSGIYLSGGTLVITGTEIISNTLPNVPILRRGGGLFLQNGATMTMTHSLVAGNPSEGGGGIYAINADVYLSEVTVQDNTVTTSSGGIFAAGSNLLIENSTISGNEANTAGAGIRLGNSTLLMVNSTVSGNQAGNGSGGIYADASSTADILFSTIVSNTGTSGVESAGTITMSNSIIANHVLDCASALAVDGGYNLDSDGSCGLTASTSLSNTNPMLLPLALNGGETKTHLPLFSSPVRDVIPVNVNGCGTAVISDQQGAPRPRGTGCDVGAVEAIPNSIPIAVTDFFTATEDIMLVVPAPGVLVNDVDGDGHTLTAVLSTTISYGTLDLVSSGAFTYTGAADFCGVDQFSYEANDGYDFSNPVTVTLAVVCVNDLPIATDNTFTVTEDSPNNILDVLVDDSDVDGDSLTITEIGMLSAGGTAVNNTSTISYTPALNFFGMETFTYTVSDGNGGEATAVVTVTVSSVNDPPIAVSDIYTTSEGIPLAIAAPGVLSNDMDVDNAILTATLASDVVSGTLALVVDGSFTYTPDEAACGTDQFTYQASDGIAFSLPVTVTLQVACLPPTGQAGGPYLVDEGGSVVLDGSGSSQRMLLQSGDLMFEWDFDYDGSNFDVDGMGVTTTLSAGNLDGPDLFVIGLRVTNGIGLSDIVTTTLTVENVVPVITAVTNNGPITLEETAVISVTAVDPVDVLTYAFDCNNDLIYEIGPQAESTISCSFTTVGSHIVNVQVNDGDGGIITGSTSVTVNETTPDYFLYLPLVVRNP